MLGVDKVTKYHMEAPLNTVMFQWLMNPKTYAAMSPAQQKVIDDHCTTEWAAKLADPWADWEHAGLEKIKALPGHEVYKITDEQLTSGRNRRNRCCRCGPKPCAPPAAIRTRS